MDFTKTYDVNEFNDELTRKTLIEIYNILKDKGYNPVNQIAGYLMSGDPGYITNYNGARNMIITLDRSKILEILLKELVK